MNNETYSVMSTIPRSEMYIGEVSPQQGWITVCRCSKCGGNIMSNGAVSWCLTCGNEKPVKKPKANNAGK